MRTFILVLAILLPGQASLAQEEGAFETDADTSHIDEHDETVHQLQDPRELETTPRYQSTEVTVNNFDELKWKEVVGNTDYNEEPVAKSELSNVSLPWAGPVLKLVGYAVIIGIVVFLLYFILRNIKFTARLERGNIETDDMEQPLVDIEEVDIGKLLAQAIREGNLRMAVRLYYLGLLKRLNAMGKISWTKDKTNRDYLGELFSNGFYYQEVRRLTQSYEAVWYGEHSLAGESFARLQQNFEQLYQDMHQAEPG